MDTGLLIVRVVVGTLLVGHGLQKLAGWFGGYGLRGTGGYLESSFGFRPGLFWAVVAGVAEAGGGLLLGLGLFTPLGAVAVAGTMVVAMRTDHAGKGPWYFNGGWEYNLVLIALALQLAFGGPGEASLDHALDWDLSGIGWGVAATAATLASAVVTMASRPRTAAPDMSVLDLAA